MSRPLIVIIDGLTQESVTREMNDVEFAQYEIDKVEMQKINAAQAEENAKVVAKQAAKAEALAALGLSQEVVNLLAE
jgi:hypothetical protein